MTSLIDGHSPDEKDFGISLIQALQEFLQGFAAHPHSPLKGNEFRVGLLSDRAHLLDDLLEFIEYIVMFRAGAIGAFDRVLVVGHDLGVEDTPPHIDQFDEPDLVLLLVRVFFMSPF